MTDPLTERSLRTAVEALVEKDTALKSVVERYGVPPLWARQPGFATLVHIILEQQVSLASAKACFDKLSQRVGQVEPSKILSLSDQDLLEIGFSRQKTRYVRILAQALEDQQLDLDGLQSHPDEEVHRQLTGLTGIGTWTANIYLLMALGRHDIWPAGDLALVAALKDLYHLDERPDRHRFLELGNSWRPYRAVAARILWHYYLSKK